MTYVPKKTLEVTDNDSIKVADLAYYKLTICEEKSSGKLAGLFNRSTYDQFLFYVNKNLEKDFISLYDQKEIRPVQVYFETNNQMTNKLVFMLAFEKIPNETEDVVVEFNDNIFKNGLVKFNYKTKDLNLL